MKKLSRYFAAWRQYRVTVRELSALPDRDLVELGIARHEIEKVARQTAGLD